MTTLAYAPSPRRFSRDEYYRMFRMGMFEGQRVELIQGEIITMSPQTSPHALTCAIVNGWLVKTLGDDFTVRCQLPLVASNDTEPEPDFAVLPGSPQLQRDHPTTALLVIEIAVTSLSHDRRKADLYASRHVPEYWILDVKNRRLERFIKPLANSQSSFGYRYSELSTLTENESIQPTGLAISSIAISRLLPAPQVSADD